jgi:hypothetical protein
MDKISKKIKFLIILFAIFLISMGVFEYFFLSSQIALAFENVYIENTKFYNDNTDGLIFEFKVKTSFNPDITAYWSRIFAKYGAEISDIYNRNPSCNPNPTQYISPNLTNGTTLSAGQTYKILLKYLKDSTCNSITKSRWEYLIGHTLTQDDYLKSYSNTAGNFFKSFVPTNTILANFSEYPTLQISYPLNNAEIAGDFSITGTFTQPSPYLYENLTAIFYWYDENNPENQFNFITGQGIYLTATSTQSITIPIENLPKSDPQFIGIRFTATGTQAEGHSFDDELKIKTMYIIGEWPPPSYEGPNVISYFNTGEIDIYSPTSIGGTYYIDTPTSSVKFILTPDIRVDNNIWIYEQLEGGNVETILATTTISDLTGEFFGQIVNRIFEVEGIFASTSTPAWLTAEIRTQTGTLISQNNWRILGVIDEQIEGDYGVIGNFINQQIKQFLYIQPETEQAYYNLGETIKTKIPISYFYDIKKVFEGIDMNTTTPFPAFSAPLGDETLQINMLDTTVLNDLGLIDTFKDVQRVFLWGMFLIWLFMLGKAGPKQIQMDM